MPDRLIPSCFSLLSSRFILPATTLWEREVVRFYRQRSRVVGALLPPVIFWFLIGSGLGGSFQQGSGSSVASGSSFEKINYLQYFFPGTIIMIVLFTAIFSTISIIEDRREGFLQSVLVAPVWRSSIAFGKICGGATLAFLQGLVFIILAPTLGIAFRLVPTLFILGMLFAISFGLTALGFLIAWQMESTQGFHAIMNLFLMPMWFLSGALFPLESAPQWLRWLMIFDPLTYGVAALRYGFYSSNLGSVQSFPSPAFCFVVTLLFCCLTFLLSVIVSSRSNGNS